MEKNAQRIFWKSIRNKIHNLDINRKIDKPL